MWSLLTAVALAALVLAAGGPRLAATQTPVAAADPGSQEEAPGEAGFVERLVALEQEVPPLPPETVTVDDDASWGRLQGDFAGAKVLLDTVADRARDLFVEASDADGPVAAAVADGARGILELGEAYDLLATWEAYDLPFPLEGSDAEGVATGADEAYGLAEAGLRLLLEAHARRLEAFAALHRAAPSGPTATVVAARHDAEVAFDSDVRPALHRALSLDTTAVAHVLDRFTTTAPGVEARARTTHVACVPRADEPPPAGEDAPDGPGPDHPGSPSATASGGGSRPRPRDCPDVAAPSEARAHDASTDARAHDAPTDAR